MQVANQPSDEELACAAQEGNQGALALLLQRYHVPLYAHALRRLGSRWEAEDAVQETALVALRSLSTLSSPGAVGAWLHLVLGNVCRMRWRREMREPFPLSAARCDDHDDAALHSIERLAMREWVWNAVATLPESLRVTVLLRYFGANPSYAQIADILGVPIGTVRSRLSQAKARLHAALREPAGAERTGDQSSVEWNYRAAYGELNRGAGYDRVLEMTSPTMQIVSPGGQVNAEPGLFASILDENIRAGVKLHVTNLITSGAIVILEGNFQNPETDPFHCPPATTQVHFQRDGRTVRLHLYYYDVPA